MFVTLTLNPAVDCTLSTAGALTLDAVHQVIGETRTPGGKGVNVAKAIAAAGGRVIAAGLLGEADDAFFRAALEAGGIHCAFRGVPHPTRTNILVSGRDGRELKLNRAGFPELAPDWVALERYVCGLLPDCRVVIMSGSLPARFPPDTYARLITLVQAAGKDTVLDASGAPLRQGVAAGPTVIKPNRGELAELLGQAPRDEPELLAAMRQLARHHRVVIVSDGARGAYFAAGDTLLLAHAPAVNAVDSTAAGDTLLGQFCTDYFATGRLTPELAAAAVAAGAAAVEQHGTPVVSRQRILELQPRVQVETR